MAKYIKKPVVVEAITFEEFIQFGKDNGGNIVNGMPWSFTYNGLPVSHSNDESYLIPWNNGCFNEFTPLDVLITDENNFTYPKRKDYFEKFYQEIVDTNLESYPKYVFTTADELATIIQTSFSQIISQEDSLSFDLYAKPLRIDEASEFLQIPKSTLYQLTSNDKIPFTKAGKRILFMKHELIKWLKNPSDLKPKN